MYHKILVPLDGSEFAERALPTAIELAGVSNAKIHLFSVFDGHLQDAFDEIGRVEHLDATDMASVHLAGQAAEVADHGIGASTSLVISRHPAEEIVREIEETGADLVVMTTHGRSGLRRWLIGSVAEKVLRASPVPVLLYPIRSEG